MVDQNDSIIQLSTLDATRPEEPSRPASRSRWPKTQEVCGTSIVAPKLGGRID